jgi:hypothetical protein
MNDPHTDKPDPGEEWALELQMEQDRVDRAFGRSIETLYEESD